MSAEEIQLFNHSIAFHQPVAIGSFLLFALIYRSKFYSTKKTSILNEATINQKLQTIPIKEAEGDLS